MRWGLVPFWAKDLKIGSRMINAQAENLVGPLAAHTELLPDVISPRAVPRTFHASPFLACFSLSFCLS